MEIGIEEEGHYPDLVLLLKGYSFASSQEEEPLGYIGVLGGRRMPYKKVLSLLFSFSHLLSRVLEESLLHPFQKEEGKGALTFFHGVSLLKKVEEGNRRRKV